LLLTGADRPLAAGLLAAGRGVYLLAIALIAAPIPAGEEGNAK
jgi:hypothetical protein